MSNLIQIPSLPNYEVPINDKGGNTGKNWYFFFTAISQLFGGGFTGTIATAKLTGGGANGSMTFTNGVLTSQTPAT
jgi:hypothetical protein